MSDPTIQRGAVDLLTLYLSREPVIEGAFLAGSLARRDHDDYADVDIGIVTRQGRAAVATAYGLRHVMLQTIGKPIHSLERGWQHCQMIAALYSKSAFPPLGLQVDLVFSELRHVGEQMPYSEYQVLYDPRGRLRPALDSLPKTRTLEDTKSALESASLAFPFFVHDATIAAKRGDPFYVQQMLEQIRQAIFQTAAARQDAVTHDAKHAYEHLTPCEARIVAGSYADSSAESVERLAALYLECLRNLGPHYATRKLVRWLDRTVTQVS